MKELERDLEIERNSVSLFPDEDYRHDPDDWYKIYITKQAWEILWKQSPEGGGRIYVRQFGMKTQVFFAEELEHGPSERDYRILHIQPADRPKCQVRLRFTESFDFRDPSKVNIKANDYASLEGPVESVMEAETVEMMDVIGMMVESGPASADVTKASLVQTKFIGEKEMLWLTPVPVEIMKIVSEI
jgi:hypothetical protein